MMEVRELEELLSILRREDVPLEEVAQQFRNTFPWSEQFKVGCAVCMLLEDNLLALNERIVAFFVLAELYQSSASATSTNPFLPFFTHALERTLDSTEQVFLNHIVTSPPSDRTVAKLTSAQVVTDFAAAAAASPPSLPDIAALKRLYADRAPAPPVLHADAPRPVVSYPDADADTAPTAATAAADSSEQADTGAAAVDAPPPASPSARSTGPTAGPRSLPPRSVSAAAAAATAPSCSAGAAGTAGLPPALAKHVQVLAGDDMAVLEPDAPSTTPALLAMRGFEPAFVRPLPPGLALSPDEVVWVNPDDGPGLLWDAGDGGNDAGLAEFRPLMAAALTGPLPQTQQKQMRMLLTGESKLVFQSGLTPEQLPRLVDNNPMVATDCLLTLMKSPRVTDFLEALVSMDMSLHSMEVVNRLTLSVELPPEFLNLYISNCISCCEAIQDKYKQNRLVRLVCVFLQSLIRNRIFNVNELYIEVQAFCIDFSRIREAAGLFRLLKTLDKDGAPTDDPSGQDGPTAM